MAIDDPGIACKNDNDHRRLLHFYAIMKTTTAMFDDSTSATVVRGMGVLVEFGMSVLVLDMPQSTVLS